MSGGRSRPGLRALNLRGSLAPRLKRRGAIDLSDSNEYLLIVPTSMNFELLDSMLGDDRRRVSNLILVDDGEEGEGLDAFLDVMDKVTSGAISRGSIREVMGAVSELASYLREGDAEALVVCTGPLAARLLNLAMLLSCRAVEIVEDSFSELPAFPPWKLSEEALSIILAIRELEGRGEKATSQAVARLVRLRVKQRGGRSTSTREKSKVVTVNYYYEKQLKPWRLVDKERVEGRGVVYKLLPKGRVMADFAPTYLASIGRTVEELLELPEGTGRRIEIVD